MQARPFPRPPLWGWLALLPALCSLSCSDGGRLHPVRGQVLYQDQPAKGVLVTFHPEGAQNEVTAVRPVGLTGEDGTFTLTTGENEGAPAGAYLVTLIWPEVVAPKGSKGFSMEPPDTRDRFQGAYASRERFKLRVEVRNGPNQLEPFRLK